MSDSATETVDHNQANSADHIPHQRSRLLAPFYWLRQLRQSVRSCPPQQACSNLDLRWSKGHGAIITAKPRLKS